LLGFLPFVALLGFGACAASGALKSLGRLGKLAIAILPSRTMINRRRMRVIPKVNLRTSREYDEVVLATILAPGVKSRSLKAAASSVLASLVQKLHGS
jgi:hypothetical protein